MRTTVTIDQDVEHQLKRFMRERRLSFKAAINQALRRGLVSAAGSENEPPFKVEARALELRAGIDPARLNAAVDDLEAGAFSEVSQRTCWPGRGVAAGVGLRGW
jgi:hypothetical protein